MACICLVHVYLSDQKNYEIFQFLPFSAEDTREVLMEFSQLEKTWIEISLAQSSTLSYVKSGCSNYRELYTYMFMLAQADSTITCPLPK